MHHILLYLCSYYSCLSWGLHFTTSTFNNYKWISFVLGVIDVTTNCFIVKISTLIYFAFVHSASPWEYSQEGAGSPSEVKCFCLWSNVNTLRWLPFQNNKNEKVNAVNYYYFFRTNIQVTWWGYNMANTSGWEVPVLLLW